MYSSTNQHYKCSPVNINDTEFWLADINMIHIATNDSLNVLYKR